MSFKCGIVGLPNVGKSTLFNALTNSSKAQAGNFPFCTIDPNIGIVPVPDDRLKNLAEKKINELWPYIKKQLDNKNQIFWVCPLIEESKKLDYSAAEQKYQTL